MVIKEKKRLPDSATVGKGPTQRREVEESTRHKWVKVILSK